MTGESREERFQRHGLEWRDEAAALSMWREAGESEAGLFEATERGAFWDAVARAGVSLCVSREYEHLLLVLSTDGGRPHVSYLRLPHPSGIARDAVRERVFVASTRNPNQIFELAPCDGLLERRELAAQPSGDEAPGTLVPLASIFLPGASYVHDLAFVDGTLHANAVGCNAIVRVTPGRAGPVWWPKSIDRPEGPAFDANYLQLNSIAAGRRLAESFFTASCERPLDVRPGDERFPVDRTGVLFSGATREPAARGLTRPHSARLRDGMVWLDNSGYGEFGFVRDGTFEPALRLPGWTRGLCFAGGLAFVGTSRVIPRFRHYAPGLDVERSECGLHAVDLASGTIAGSLLWPEGNQIFAVEALPSHWRLPFVPEPGTQAAASALFYAFKVQNQTSS